MTTTVAKKDIILPWGVEIELVEGRCVYMGAKTMIVSDNLIEVIVNNTNSIQLPRKSVRKIMIMVTPYEQRTEDGSDS